MTFGAAAAWTLPAALMLMLASASSAVAETTAAAMTAFGLTGTWSEDCTKDPAKEGARLTYSPPGARTPSYLFVLFDNNGNKITFSADVLSADRLPSGKLKTVTVKTGRNGDATALQAWERVPVETIIIKVGPKIQSVQSRQINGGRRFLVDGQIVAENSRGELQTIRPAPLLEMRGLNGRSRQTGITGKEGTWRSASAA